MVGWGGGGGGGGCGGGGGVVGGGDGGGWVGGGLGWERFSGDDCLFWRKRNKSSPLPTPKKLFLTTCPKHLHSMVINKRGNVPVLLHIGTNYKKGLVFWCGYGVRRVKELLTEI